MPSMGQDQGDISLKSIGVSSLPKPEVDVDIVTSLVKHRVYIQGNDR